MKMLNIDRVREMSADELAEIIRVCPGESDGIECNCLRSCRECRLDWLYKECDDDAPD